MTNLFNPNKQTFLQNLNPLLFIRFIAAVLVIRQHVNFPILNNKYMTNIGWLFGGDQGSGNKAVVVFFVISAYLMSKIWFSGKYKLSLSGVYNFYLTRIARIVPVFYLVCIISIFTHFPYLIEPGNKLYGRVIRIFLFLDSGEKFNQVIWSVGVEMLFYLIVPILVLIGVGTSRAINNINPILTKIGMYCLLAFCFVCIQNLGNCYSLNPTLVAFLDLFSSNWLLRVVTSLVLFFPIFMSGFIFYPIIKRHVDDNKFQFINRFKLSFILPVIFMMHPNTDSVSLVISTLIFIFIVENIGKNTNNNTLPENTISNKTGELCNHLGNLSYCIYLFHMLILIRFNEVYAGYLITKFGAFGGGVLIWVIVTVITIIISNFFYHSFEEKVRKSILKKYLIRS